MNAILRKGPIFLILASFCIGMISWFITLIAFIIEDEINPPSSLGHADFLLYCTIVAYASSVGTLLLGTFFRLFLVKFSGSIIEYCIQVVIPLVLSLCLLGAGYYAWWLEVTPPPDDDDVEFFISELDSDNAKELKLAIDILGGYGGESMGALPKLRIIAESNPDKEIRDQAQSAIKKIEADCEAVASADNKSTGIIDGHGR